MSHPSASTDPFTLPCALLCALLSGACSGTTDGTADASDGTAGGTSDGMESGTGDSGDDSVPVAGDDDPPNLLLIISDDQGLDASAQYALGEDRPDTPVLDALAADGLVFDNAWATPSCTTTRGALITGRHGVNSGVDTVPDLLDTDALTLQRFLGDEGRSTGHASAVIGKWHLAGGDPDDPLHPIESGVGHYAGTLSGVIDDYERWPLTRDGATTTATTYHTTAMTDLAIEWLDERREPWFLWLAYVAPHAPFHLPPLDLHARTLSGDEADIRADPRPYYLAAIEAMDAEIGRLLDTLPDDVRENTLIVFVGDNGTPARVIDEDVYPRDHGKGTLYEGGIRVPMVVSGAGVTRAGEREPALVNSTDVFATFAEAVGLTPPATLDGQSFLGLLSSGDAPSRAFNYSEFVDADVTGWAVRDATLKLVELADGTRELYDLEADPREATNLIDDAGIDVARVAALDAFSASIRTPAGDGDASTDTAVLPTGSDGVIDITDATLTATDVDCAAYANAYRAEATDVASGTRVAGSLIVSVEGDRCVFSTGALPNHDFNDGARAFANPVAGQDDTYFIPSAPAVAAETTPLSLTVDDAILLNGVKVDLLAAACFGVGDERVGCNDPEQPWRFDPMHVPNGFRVDSHNAHTQPDGTYHYHGVPNALYADDGATVSPVVGFAADGFPIFGSQIEEDGAVRAVRPSYRLKEGARPGGDGEPGGVHDGTFRDDYTYVAGSGDLDECNGRSVDGVYRYHMTDGFPYVLGCFRGTPDASFIKRR